MLGDNTNPIQKLARAYQFKKYNWQHKKLAYGWQEVGRLGQQ